MHYHSTTLQSSFMKEPHFHRPFMKFNLYIHSDQLSRLGPLQPLQHQWPTNSTFHLSKFELRLLYFCVFNPHVKHMSLVYYNLSSCWSICKVHVHMQGQGRCINAVFHYITFPILTLPVLKSFFVLSAKFFHVLCICLTLLNVFYFLINYIT